jgi:hypothetical protein
LVDIISIPLAKSSKENPIEKQAEENNIRRPYCRYSFTMNGNSPLLICSRYLQLRLLKIDPMARQKNRSAVAKRKQRRKIYTNPTMQIIDDFRYGVEFERAGLLKQLRLDI